MSQTGSPKPFTTSRAFDRPAMKAEAASAELIERNLATALRFVEKVLGQGDIAVFEELVAEDVWVSTGLKPEAPVRGKAEYLRVIGSTIGTALSNGSMTIHEALPTLDGAVIVRFTAEADHTGELDGMPATGRRWTLSETHLMRFRDGQLVENYVGALNPLQWEMYYSPVIAKKVLTEA